jgi:hypothetical protein
MNVSPLVTICASALGVVFLVMIFAFIRGSRGLRAYIVTRVLLTIPMVFILVTVVFLVTRCPASWGRAAARWHGS